MELFGRFNPRFMQGHFGSGLVIISLFLTILGIYQAVDFTHPLYYWDHFSYLQSYQMWDNGVTSFWDFLHRSHNEHRIDLTKIILLFDITLFDGNNVLISAFNIATLFFSGFLIIKEAVVSLPSNLRLGAAMLGGAAMIGGVSLGNTAWPTQLQFGFAQLIPVLLFLTIFHLRPTATTITCMACLAAASAGTMANGIFAPPAAAIVALTISRDRVRFLIIVLLCAVSAGLYLLPTPFDHDISVARRYGLGLSNIVYYFSASGNFLQWTGVTGAIISGGILTIIAAWVGLAAFRRSPIDDPHLCVLLAMMVYSSVSILVMAITRGTDGQPEWALTSRYSTPSLIFALSTAGTLLRYSYLRLNSDRLIIWIFRGLAILIFFISVASSTGGERAISDLSNRNKMLNMVEAAIYNNYFTSELYKEAFPSPDELKKLVNFMRERQIGIFSRRNHEMEIRQSAHSIERLRSLAMLKSDPLVNPSADLQIIDSRLQAHAPARLISSVPKSKGVRLAYGIRDGAWREGETNGICFKLLKVDDADQRAEGSGAVIWSQCLDPVQNPKHRGLQISEIEFNGLPPSKVAIDIDCQGNCAWDWSYIEGIENLESTPSH